MLVQKQLKWPLVTEMKKAIEDFYGENPLKSNHLAKIINDRQFERLNNLLGLNGLDLYVV